MHPDYRNCLDYEKKAYQFMMYLGADYSLPGVRYLIHMIGYCLMTKNLTPNMTGNVGLYGKTARHFKAESWQSVSRAVGRAIASLHRMQSDAYNEVFIFGGSVTPKQFIRVACNFITFEAEKIHAMKSAA